MDNTLADRKASFGRWAWLLVERFSLVPEVIPRLVHTDGDGLVPGAEFLRVAQQRLALPATPEALMRWYELTYPTCYVREDESVPALASLRAAGWKVAVVTNGSTEQRLAKLGLGGSGVGLRTAWLHRGRTWNPSVRAPDLICRTTGEVVGQFLTHDG